MADIPGLNSYNQEENKVGDLNEIFFAIKDLVSFGFLIFDSFQYTDFYALTIVEELMNGEENKIEKTIDDKGSIVEYKFKKKKLVINNFLIILNKIDKVEKKDQEQRLKLFKANFLKNSKKLGDELLSETNTIISLDCNRLIEEEN